MVWVINGRMTKKLLHKSSQVYLLFSIIVLMVTAPLFYYLAEKLYVDETDEMLNLHKREFTKFSLPHLSISEIENWNRYNRNFKILPFNGWRNDSIYTKTYFDLLDNEREPYRELNVPILVQGNPYTYSARINLVETEDLMKSIAWLFLLILSLLLIGLFVITKKISINLWKPFNETLNQIEKFEIDKSDPPVFVGTDIEEFVRLNASIEKLIKKNTAIYQSQKEFVENAAHELQTPLAVFQAKLDLLMQQEGFSQEQVKMLDALNESVFRLNRLNKNLLLLSKLERDHYSGKEEIDINEAISKNLDFFTEQAKEKNLSIQMELNGTDTVQSNAVLLEMLLSNLFMNAIRHNIQNGRILVKSTNNGIVFMNSGEAEALKESNLFKRFSKSNASLQGNGLGLSIVKKIIEINNWSIVYSFENNLHTFSIGF